MDTQMDTQMNIQMDTQMNAYIYNASCAVGYKNDGVKY